MLPCMLLAILLGFCFVTIAAKTCAPNAYPVELKVVRDVTEPVLVEVDVAAGVGSLMLNFDLDLIYQPTSPVFTAVLVKGSSDAVGAGLTKESGIQLNLDDSTVELSEGSGKYTLGIWVVCGTLLGVDKCIATGNPAGELTVFQLADQLVKAPIVRNTETGVLAVPESVFSYFYGNFKQPTSLYVDVNVPLEQSAPGPTLATEVQVFIEQAGSSGDPVRLPSVMSPQITESISNVQGQFIVGIFSKTKSSLFDKAKYSVRFGFGTQPLDSASGPFKQNTCTIVPAPEAVAPFDQSNPTNTDPKINDPSANNDASSAVGLAYANFLWLISLAIWLPMWD